VEVDENVAQLRNPKDAREPFDSADYYKKKQQQNEAKDKKN
jgi:hypothetical protein